MAPRKYTVTVTPAWPRNKGARLVRNSEGRLVPISPLETMDFMKPWAAVRFAEEWAARGGYAVEIKPAISPQQMREWSGRGSS